MKKIIETYRTALNDMQRANDNLVSDLKYHIAYLEGVIKGQEEKIDILSHPDKLQQEIDEYNRTEAQHNMNLEDELVKLKAMNEKLEVRALDLNSINQALNRTLERRNEEIKELTDKLEKAKEDANAAAQTGSEWEERFYTLVKAYDINLDKPVKTSAVHHCGDGEPKVYKPKKKHTGGKAKGSKLPKNILRHCVDCKKYYYAASKLSQRCDSCADEYRRKYQREWMKNHPKKK